MVRHKRHTLSSGIFDKKYPQPLTHWETERWYARRAKRNEYNKKIILKCQQMYNKIFRRSTINKVQPM